MNRKINNYLFCIALALVLLACGICFIGAFHGPFYMKTNGSSSENVANLFSAILSGDGNACVNYTDSYKEIDFDASGETGAVADLCAALQNSYDFRLLPDSSGESPSLTEEDIIDFTFLDLNLLSDAIALTFDDYVYDTVVESDAAAVDPEGDYLPEIYEQAYARALSAALQRPESYYTKEQLQLNSVYETDTGSWNTILDKKCADMLLGGFTDGGMSDTLSVPEAVQKYVKNTISLLTGDPEQNQVVYTLPYSSSVGPKPDTEKYFRYPIDQADQVLNRIAYARSCGLLDNQQVIFNPEASFYPDDIRGYCDETILVICWKEYINGSVCNCMEVKIADGSQIKRKLTGDVYNSGILDYMSNMSAATNAVAAMSGDYYAYRFFGTTVYQGQLHRFDQYCELMMIDDQGKLLFYYPHGETAEELQEFLDQNHVQFGLAFGPVLIEDYTPHYYQYGYAYGLGQMTESYTRAALGEFDDLHYLFMTSGYAVNAVPPDDLDAFIDILLTKNLRNAYNLDGGQTAEIVIQNEPYNQIDYRAERQMSDMIFFATALPEKES